MKYNNFHDSSRWNTTSTIHHVVTVTLLFAVLTTTGSQHTTVSAFTARLPRRYSYSIDKRKRTTNKKSASKNKQSKYEAILSALSYQNESDEDPTTPTTTSKPSSSIGGSINDDDDDLVAAVAGHDNHHTPNGKENILRKDDPTLSSSQFVSPQTSSVAPSTKNNEEKESLVQIWRMYGKQLYQLCRPSNFLGVVVFHVLGTHLAMMSTSSSHVAAKSYSLIQLLLKEPSMWNTLFILLGITSTSMMVNDYYDTKLGVDTSKTDNPLQQVQVDKDGHVHQKLPLWVVKKCLVCGYGFLLPAIAWMPSVIGRTTAILSVMLTYWYTKHLKPKTWIKNITCASIIALAPLTSGAMAYHLLHNTNTGSAGLASLLWTGTAAATAATTTTTGITKLGQMILMIFLGIMGREITMDCSDVQDDASHQIHTLPVQYGTKFASKISLLCYTLMGIVAVGGHSYGYVTAAKQGVLPNILKVVLASLGSFRMIQRAWQVYSTQGQNKEINSSAIDEGKTTMLLLLASYV